MSVAARPGGTLVVAAFIGLVDCIVVTTLSKNGGFCTPSRVSAETRDSTELQAGEEKLARDLSYWKFSNYFKAGCYPQATQGTVQVFFRKLKAE